ncbi:hypothetical protein HMPREF1409_00235, partial [Helicobacter pylori GAM246Ai]
MAKSHKHDYHGNAKPTKINKRKRKEKHENQKISLALSFSHALI